jgi:UDP-galactopyranose mutase
VPQPDLLVVGAGPAGSVIAERAATIRGWTVLVVERRPHIAGHCHDVVHPSGVLVHAYGPHYFRSSLADTVSYLSRFTEWRPARYVVKSHVRGRLYPFPINLESRRPGRDAPGACRPTSTWRTSWSP